MSMPALTTRRDFLLAAAGSLFPSGVVVGEETGARIGERVLAGGGNAVDAVVTAALVAGVVALPACGIGGYGGHMVIAMKGRKAASIDFNSMAPARVPDRVHRFGWLAAGVPGTLAGMDLAVKRYGTIGFRRAVQPAIELAREGFPVTKQISDSIGLAQKVLSGDPGSRRLLLPGGPPAEGALFRNPDLAAMLEKLAADDSAEAFYRGEIGRQIAAEFAQRGGLVTAEDMAAYQAREVEPIEMSWGKSRIFTAPLTAGGLTVIEALRILQASGIDAASEHWDFARLEALRIAWHDRLRLLGDPEKARVPVGRLLSARYAEESGGRVKKAVHAGKPMKMEGDPAEQSGTIHLSAGDREGNMAALTLTHGDGFGARVTVDGMGLILGHGMSRFDPRTGQPNSMGPRKRPLHNMCPTVVVREGAPVLAVGARGGRRIPNSVYDVLTRFVAENRNLEQAVRAGRMNTTGGLELKLDSNWRNDQADRFARLGYKIERSPGANVSAIAAESGRLTKAQG